MRTKTLLLTAALAVAGAASSMAQVYSVNAVGYINLTINPGFQIIANQLNASPDNTVASVFPTLSAACIMFTFDNVNHRYNSSNGYDPLGGWDDPSQVINPGSGIFFYSGAASPFTVTIVGEVPQGTLNTPLGAGFNLLASQVPQAGLLQTQLGYTPSTGNGDVVFQYDSTLHKYKDSVTYDSGAGWDPAEPTLAVGEGAFVFRSQAGQQTWTRTFNVNTP